MNLTKLMSVCAASVMLLGMTACSKNSAAPTAPTGDVQTEAVTSEGTDATAAPEDQTPPAGEAGSRQTVVVEGFDWGPAVTKTIISLDVDVAPDSVSPESFSVVETKESFNWAATTGADPNVDPSAHITVDAPRTVTAAYTCDAEGNKSEEASSFIALELAYDPNTGSPYCYDVLTWHNTVCNPYELSVTLTEASTLASTEGAVISKLVVDPAVDLSAAMAARLEGVDLSGTFTGTDGKTLAYASFAPADDGNKHPLVIWVHGAGEGGTDPSIPVLGNKVTALYEEEFQTIMGGAYVLTPQVPDFWLVFDEADHTTWGQNPGKPSIYTATLMELIEKYVADNENIDTNRIYIGGCSNGGFMTVNMVLQYPDYFAAAFPICEAYLDEGITDEQLEGIKNLPIWFVYAENDELVPPQNYEIPTIERLQAMEANVHSSVFPNVVDTTGNFTAEDGSPYEYMGHWSWLYFFNNQCEENGMSLWKWLAAQSKG